MRPLGLLLLVVVGCHGAPYEPPAPTLPPSWSAGVSEEAVEREWWRSFGDAELDALVARALQENLDLALASARLREARAVVGIIGGESYPRADLGAAAVRREPSTAVAGGEFLPQDDAGFYSLGLDVRWELDLFGRRARAVEAAEAEFEATAERARAVRVSVLAEVARLHLEGRGLAAEEELELRQRTLALRTLALVEARVEAGLDDERAALAAREELATISARIPLLAAERRARALALGVMLGLRPDELEVSDLEDGAAAQPPTPPSAIARGLPLELLTRRPDLRAAERDVARAWAEGRQAEAELYPVLSLDAALGVESESLDDLFSGSARAFSVGPSLTAPLFRGGILRWAVRAADAREEAARLAYERAVLEALREVEEGLTRVQREGERLIEVEALREQRRQGEGLARVREQAGLEGEIERAAAESRRLEAERSWVQARTGLALASIRLYKALGGGWEEEESIPEG